MAATEYAIDLSAMRQSGDFIVRRAAIEDLDLLVPLFDAYRQFYRKTPDAALARQFLQERLERDESIIFLAMDSKGTAAWLYTALSKLLFGLGRADFHFE